MTATNKYKGYPIIQTDKSNGSVMDVDRPMQAPYSSTINQQIGPQSKTDFGRNEDQEK